jgi:hypothetical protein
MAGGEGGLDAARIEKPFDILLEGEPRQRRRRGQDLAPVFAAGRRLVRRQDLVQGRRHVRVLHGRLVFRNPVVGSPQVTDEHAERGLVRAEAVEGDHQDLVGGQGDGEGRLAVGVERARGHLLPEESGGQIAPFQARRRVLQDHLSRHAHPFRHGEDGAQDLVPRGHLRQSLLQPVNIQGLLQAHGGERAVRASSLASQRPEAALLRREAEGLRGGDGARHRPGCADRPWPPRPCGGR